MNDGMCHPFENTNIPWHKTKNKEQKIKNKSWCFVMRFGIQYESNTTLSTVSAL